MHEGSEDDPEAAEDSELGRKEHWDAVYQLELSNLQEHGDEGELWFGEDVMETMVQFTMTQIRAAFGDTPEADISILDIGTGNGVLPLELASQGFAKVTGSDYSQASIDLAKAVARRRGMTGVKWVVGDVLQSSVSDRYSVVTDKGTFDAIGLSEDGQSKQALYIRCVHSLLQPGGLLIITSCNSTLQELVSGFTVPSEAAATASDIVAVDHEARADIELKRKGCVDESGMSGASRAELHPCQRPAWVYADHVRTYRVFSFGGYEGSKVCTVAFKRADDIHRL